MWPFKRGRAGTGGASVKSESLESTSLPSAAPPADDGSVLPGPDLREASLAEQNLSGKCFHNAVLRDANLRGCNLRFADFRDADLSGADMTDAKLQGADFSGAKLRKACLAGATGLSTCSFGGADLSQADVGELSFSAIATLEAGAKQTATLSQIILLAAAYVCLTIGTTSDLQLLTNTQSSQLPIISTQVPIVAFYYVCPLLLTVLYCYFHLSLIELMNAASALPRFFPDQRTLDQVVEPGMVWSAISFWRPRSTGGVRESPRLHAVIGVIVVWGGIPLVVLLLWQRYLYRHELLGTALQLGLFLITVAIGTYSYGEIRNRLSENIEGVGRPKTAVEGNGPFNLHVLRRRRWRLVAGFGGLSAALMLSSALAAAGMWCRANIAYSDVSKRPGEPTGKPVGAEIRGANLRGLNGRGVYAAGSNFTGSDFTGAILADADLSHAALRGVRFNGASLQRVNLDGADAQDADFTGTDLRGATVTTATRLAEKWRTVWLLSNHGEVPSDLIGRDLQGGFMPEVDLGRFSLAHANLSGANLDGAQLSGASLDFCDLSRASLRQAYLINSRLVSADLRGADLSGAILRLANLRGSVLDSQTRLDDKWYLVWSLVNEDTRQRALIRQDVSGAYLQKGHFREATISGTVLSGSDLTDADFRGATLDSVDFDGSVLNNADFRGATLRNIRGLTKPQLQSLCADETTQFDDADMKATMQTATNCGEVGQ